MEILQYDFKLEKGGVTAPKGFMASGVTGGIKTNNERDIAIVYSEKSASAAGIFTRNKIRGHSLELCSRNIKKGKARCIFINSGNANACLGPSGYNDAITIAKKCALELGIQSSEVLTGSTGIIGHPLPMEKIISGIEAACNKLSPDGGTDAAMAIMTTDTTIKEISVKLKLNDYDVTIGGMAKGSGMINPDMATMIGILTTDARISSELLKALLKESADKSFNRITIDGDTSVCDKVLLLANGMSGAPMINENTPEYDKFRNALTAVSIELAKMIAADGEGASKLIEINVKNAMTPDDAHNAAKAVANSPLVKTAFYGEDANWGRILTALGYCGVDFDPNKTSIKIGSLILYNNGIAIPFDEDSAKKTLEQKEIIVSIDFCAGSFDTTVWTCDLSPEYIEINANYRT